MKNALKLTVLIVASILITSCTTNDQLKNQMKEIIAENPDILFEAIEKEPEKFMEVVQVAAQKAQANMAKNREEQEKKALEASFNNPLKPDINKSTASLGPDDAPITLVEYSDFECPYCQRGSETVKALMDKYKGKIKFVYKHLPLDFHPNAMISAQYFEAIKLQSEEKAFKFHDQIFDNHSKVRQGEKYFKTLAKNLKLDMAKLEKDIHSEKVKNTIAVDVEEAQKFGIQGTPGFIINGVPVKGAYPAEYFVGIVEELKKKGRLTL